MYLYHLSLQKPTCVLQAVHGNFSSATAQEVVVGRGRTVELLRFDNAGKLTSVAAQDVFGLVRSLQAFRLTGGTLDYAVVGSDSGKIAILRFDSKRNVFEKVHEEAFGRSGCRRIVPGQYLAIDPKGRAVMIGAVEKQKLVYILNRDANAKLTISSPLEAHKGHTITYAMVALDVGFENPLFVSLEVDYEDPKLTRKLVTYELDLGLNHVVRKHQVLVDSTSSHLVPVPGGTDGPGGVLVCSHNVVTYKNAGYPDIEVRVPQRHGFYHPEHGLMIICSAMHKQKGLFFFLLQSELGDLYKVDLAYKDDIVEEVRIHYFDSVTPGNAMAVMRNGCLFVGSEFGEHFLYQFVRMDPAAHDYTLAEDGVTPLFVPTKLTNLIPVDKLDSAAPILDTQVITTPAADGVLQQIVGLAGRGGQSSLRLIRHGLAISEMAVSDLPARPNGIWTVKARSDDKYDKYIVVSFSNGTIVLSIGDTVDEVSDAESGFLSSTSTLLVALLGDDAIIQVHPNGIRYIRGVDQRIEWKTPGNRTIMHACANTRQVVIALSGGDLLYFELDDLGQLVEVGKKELGHEVACMDIASIVKGRQRARFLAVGDWNNTVRLFSLYPDELFDRLGLQGLKAAPKSICLLRSSLAGSVDGSRDFTGSQEQDELYLSVGLQDGVLLRTVVDPATGELTDTRRRFMGTNPVSLFKVHLGNSGVPGCGGTAMVVRSNSCWLCYNHQGNYAITPISYVPLESATNFTSEQCVSGIVGHYEASLRILTIDRLGEHFNQVSIPLRYTPRQMVVHPETGYAIVAEGDCKTISIEHDKEQIEKVASMVGARIEQEKESTMDMDEEEDDEEDVQTICHAFARQQLPTDDPSWASCVQIVDPRKEEVISTLELGKGEGCFSVCLCEFAAQPGYTFVVVGSAKNVVMQGFKAEESYLTVYQMNPADGTLMLVHRTEVAHIPMALAAYHGRLLVGMGTLLRVYDLGKKKLLLKCENRNIPHAVRRIKVLANRIYVLDMSTSIHFVHYARSENRLDIVADDFVPHWMTSGDVLDYDTVAGGDKFGNFFVVRLPENVAESLKNDTTGNKRTLEQGYLNGAPNKLQTIASFHVGEVLTGMQKTSLTPGGSEVVLYTTILGAIGAFLPFASREDVDFFQHLEMHMRSEFPPLCGRDHLAFRSSYVPVKDAIDGDLCEQFAILDSAKQNKIAEELDRTPAEVQKKLEGIRQLIQ
eukprot:CAMPEP_0119132890 /NCGR_PEP_ID=MMETSP1310-20130426/12524_1 /TAXON_ID=464262 /ORGANISM="Genus nov. species nov., Strain RCC2339" /LENGTH=1215 /DNA_ID=CAMNT_0007123557 /DNA_START=66 /DNA_END=3713 /DNA_ORIENTATION=+